MSSPGRDLDLLTSTFALGTLGLLALGLAWAVAPERVAHLGRSAAGRFGHAASARAVGLGLRHADDARAREWLALAAEQGDPIACVVVADDLLAPPVQAWSGQVPDEEPPEVAQARALYVRAAAAGDPVAAQRLGVLLVDGRGGPADPVEGARWLQLAVDRAEAAGSFRPSPERLEVLARAGVTGLGTFDHPFTCLGRLHELGLGAAQDDAAAADLYRAALAQAGSHEARLGGARTWLLDLLERRPDLRRPGDPTRWRGCRLPAR